MFGLICIAHKQLKDVAMSCVLKSITVLPEMRLRLPSCIWREGKEWGREGGKELGIGGKGKGKGTRREREKGRGREGQIPKEILATTLDWPNLE